MGHKPGRVRMVDRRIMAGALAGGLVIGLTGGWLIWGQRPDIPATVASLIEDRCLPFVTGAAGFDGEGLEEIAGYNDSDDYVDPRTLIMVSVTEGPRCVVRDRLAVWTDEDRNAVFAIIEASVGSWVAVNNDGDMVLENLAGGLSWMRFLIYRPAARQGYYLIALTTGSDLGGSDVDPTTTINIGHGTFIGPARISEGQDA